MKALSKVPAGKQRVYDIGVDDNHNFLTDTGMVASNCFNKSHSVSYSVITYACSYLKAHHPVEFFAGLMTIRSKSLQPKNWALKAPEYINEAKNLNVKIYPPSVNASTVGFTIKEDEIYFGLNAIRDVGIGSARAISTARRTKPYRSVVDFVERVNLQKVNTKHFQALVHAGAFDRLGYRRQDLLDNTQVLYDFVKDFSTHYQRAADIITRDRENKEREQKKEELDLQLKAIKLKKKKKEELTIDEQHQLERPARLRAYRAQVADAKKLHQEPADVLTTDEQEEYELSIWLRKKPTLKAKVLPPRPEIKRYKSIHLNVTELIKQAEYIGCYIGTHPATVLYPNHTRIANLMEGEKASVAGAITELRAITTRRGQQMAFATIGDSTGTTELVIFPTTWAKMKDNLPVTGDIISITGEVEQIDPETKMKVFKMEIYRSNNGS